MPAKTRTDWPAIDCAFPRHPRSGAAFSPLGQARLNRTRTEVARLRRVEGDALTSRALEPYGAISRVWCNQDRRSPSRCFAGFGPECRHQLCIFNARQVVRTGHIAVGPDEVDAIRSTIVPERQIKLIVLARMDAEVPSNRIGAGGGELDHQVPAESPTNDRMFYVCVQRLYSKGHHRHATNGPSATWECPRRRQASLRSTCTTFPRAYSRDSKSTNPSTSNKSTA